ncbi:uncharacterized protein V1518DRAFT_409570 [Limtongia smithiae]|uniref:uncharacterized protein n=1 Tax=Limtongia smithiae TaxID=1125753 RepID=UPI0034CE857E
MNSQLGINGAQMPGYVQPPGAYPFANTPMPFPGAPGMAPPSLGSRPLIPVMPHIAPVGFMPTSGSGNSTYAQNDSTSSTDNRAPVEVPAMKKYFFFNDPSLRQPTETEQLRIIFIGSIPENVEDFWIARILDLLPGFSDWIRIRDALNKPQDFAFAEFEDLVSLGRSLSILADVEIPTVESKDVDKASANKDLEDIPTKLLITYSDATKYAMESDMANISAEETTKVVTGVSEQIKELLDIWKNPKARAEYRETYIAEHKDEERDAFDGLSLTAQPGDDDLTDLPPEQRVIVMKEIAAFRDRATQRERERIKREEEVEMQRLERIQAEKQRRSAAAADSSIGDNGGNAQHGVTSTVYSQPIDFDKSKDNDDMGPDAEGVTDEALEDQRRDKEEDELEERFLDRERRYMREEQARLASYERETRHERNDKERQLQSRENMSRRFADWDDDREEERRSDEYYRDRSAWLRSRSMFRSREIEMDEREAALERKAKGSPEHTEASSLATSFLQQQADELNLHRTSASRDTTPLESASENSTQKEELRRDAGPIRVALKKEETKPVSIGFAKPAAKSTSGFKLGMGPKKLEPAVRKMGGEAKVGVLDDEEEETTTKRRKLIPLSYDKV